ncbi:MAG: TlpA family protein disulfide reductase [Candidatus Delongbacteria bacterium]|nr:TlpA family protein disulfide reductase [Candidatus Delongbacteria bacterium]MBN2833410.1 TlpA family protein disulfide reductase [Candidatus Delongbacteria bacterium]
MRFYSCMIVILLVFLISCNKNQENVVRDLYSELDSLQMDLLKIPVEARVKDVGEVVFDKFNEKGFIQMSEVDSLLNVYPDSYFLMNVKINILSNVGIDSIRSFVTEKYRSDSLNNNFKYFYLLVTEPDNVREKFEKMIENDKENFLGYFGLAQTLFYKKDKKPEYVTKLAYLASVKSERNDEPLQFLDYLYEISGKINEGAYLNGILLRRDPSRKQSFDKLFTFYMDKSDYEKAAVLTEMFEKNNPGMIRDIEMAYLYMTSKKLDTSFKFLKKIDPEALQKEDLIQYYSIRSRVMAYNGDKDEALKAILEFKRITNISNADIFADESYAEYLYDYKPYKNFLKSISGNKLSIGDIALPSIKGRLIDGSIFNSDEYKNKVVLVNLWSSESELAAYFVQFLKGFKQQFSDKDFSIIGINLDSDKLKANKVIEEIGVDWRNIHEPKGNQGGLGTLFSYTSIPSSFLIDKKGVIRYFNLQGNSLLNRVKELIEEKNE